MEEEGGEQNLMSMNPAIMVYECMCEREIEKALGRGGVRERKREGRRGREGGREGGGEGRGRTKNKIGRGREMGLTTSYMTDTTEQLTPMENL